LLRTSVFVLLIRLVPGSTLFPYTTLFRSQAGVQRVAQRRLAGAGRQPRAIGAAVVAVAVMYPPGRGSGCQACADHRFDFIRSHVSIALFDRQRSVANGLAG